MQAKLVICIVFLSAQSMAVLLGGTRIHQLAVTNQPQVNQTCTMEYILARVFSQMRFDNINQSGTSVMGTIFKSLMVVLFFNELTKK